MKPLSIDGSAKRVFSVSRTASLVVAAFYLIWPIHYGDFRVFMKTLLLLALTLGAIWFPRTTSDFFALAAEQAGRNADPPEWLIVAVAWVALLAPIIGIALGRILA